MKAEPKTTALPTGHSGNLLPTQPTSSQALTLTNTVRIEKLSDEENEEVDITDDLSDDGDCNKPQSFRSQSGVTDMHTDDPAEKGEVVGPLEMVDKLDNITPQSPPRSSSLCHFETTSTARVDENTNGRTSPDRKCLQEATQLGALEAQVENEALSFQCDGSPQTCQLEEEGTNGTG